MDQERYGARHAADYADFLVAEIGTLKAQPAQGRNVPEHPDLLQFVVKRNPRGHGHIAFYQVAGDTIQIVRVLHTARDWPNLLKDE